jgi:D-beta-D-heptose 7-phosphate kinase/D-beta-D-heptose 1-phosphate adenosyltransferase
MMEKSKILAALAKCHSKNILVVGDVMLDEYHWCEVDRISPEAPVPVCRVLKTTLVPGGAANVANNIQALESTAYLAGIIGKDGTGERLKKQLEGAHVECDDLIQSEEKPTILKSRIIARHQHVVRVDREDSSPISRQAQRKILARIEERIASIDAILVSDYLKGTLTPTLLKKIMALGKRKKIPVVVDPKGDHYLRYKGAYVLTPNFHEFETVVKKKMHSEEEIRVEGMRLIKKLNLQALLVTRSEKGMSVITPDGKKKDIPTMAKEVFDITGAGDTAISVLTIALAAGLTLELSAYLANFAAGIVVGKIGTSTTTLDEIRHSITHED